MPTYDPTKIATAFRRLFTTCPLPAAVNDPAEALKVYFEVCDGYATSDIEYALKQFLAGKVEWHNPSFAPTPPLLATELRRIVADNLKYVALDRAARAQLEDRRQADEFEKSITPESRERVRQLVAGVVAQTHDSPDNVKERADRKALIEASNTYFESELVEQPNGLKVSLSLIEQLALSPPPTAEKRKAEMWAKTNARFDPSADEAGMAARLGFTAGDADGEADAA